jgi:hypothetical protein
MIASAFIASVKVLKESTLRQGTKWRAANILPKIVLDAGDSEGSMNHSLYGTDRTTHLKIVVIALAAGIALAGVAISSRVNSSGETAGIIRAR